MKFKNLNFRKYSALGVLVFISATFALTFQNCGQGFGARTSDFTTASSVLAVGINPFTIPPQESDIQYSTIAVSAQNQTIGYSPVLFQVGTLDTTSGKFQPVSFTSSVPVSKVLSATLVPMTSLISISFNDAQFIQHQGLYNFSTKNFVVINWAKPCLGDLYPYAIENTVIAVCNLNDGTTATSSIQRFDLSGNSTGSILQTSERLADFGRMMGPGRVALSSWSKILDLNSGQVSALFAASITPEAYGEKGESEDGPTNWTKYDYMSLPSFYRADRNSVIYVQDSNVHERLVSTGVDSIISSGGYVSGVDQASGSFISTTNVTNYFAPNTSAMPVLVGSSLLGVALSATHIAFVFLDSSGTAPKMTVRQLERYTPTQISNCTGANKTPFTSGGLQSTYLNSTSKYDNFIVTADCQNIFFSGYTDLSDGVSTAYNISQYSMSTSQMVDIHTMNVPRNAYIESGEILGVVANELYLFWPQEGIHPKALFRASAQNGFNYIADAAISGSATPIVSSGKNQIFTLSNRLGFASQTNNPTSLLTPESILFKSSLGLHFALLSRDASHDTANSNFYTIRYYDANANLLTSEQIDTGLTSVVPIANTGEGLAFSNNGNYGSFVIQGARSGAVVSQLLVIDIEKQLSRKTEVPISVAPYFYNARQGQLLANGDVLYALGICSFVAQSCSPSLIPEIPTINANALFSQPQIVSGDLFLVASDSSPANTTYRFHPSANGSYQKVTAQTGVWQFSSEGTAGTQYAGDTTNVWNLKTNLVTNIPFTFIGFIQNGFIASKITNSLNTLYFYNQNSSQLIPIKNGSINGGVTIIGDAYSNRVSLLIYQIPAMQVLVYNTTTQTIDFQISLNQYEGYSGKIGSDSVIFAPPYSDGTTASAQAFIFNKKTGAQTAININGFSSFACFARSMGDGLFCMGQKDGSYSLLRFDQTSNSLIAISKIDRNKAMTGLTDVSAQVSLFSFGLAPMPDGYMPTVGVSINTPGWELQSFGQAQ